MSDDTANPGDAGPNPPDQSDTDGDPTDDRPVEDEPRGRRDDRDDERTRDRRDRRDADRRARRDRRDRRDRDDQRPDRRDRRDQRPDRDDQRRDQLGDTFGLDFDPVDADDELRELGRREVERVFDVLEAALTGPDRLDEESLHTLLSTLEAAVVDPAHVDSQELDRMLSLWEAVLVDATSVDDAQRVLEIFEAAGVDDQRQSAGVLDFLDRLGLGDLLGSDRAGDAARRYTSSEDEVGAYRLARLIATVTRNATLNSGQSGVRVGTELARAAATAHSPADLLDDSRDIALSELARLGVDTGVEPDEHRRRREETRERTLREKGEALLEQSADLDYEEETHPAYDHVVDQLAPDEARILRLLATEGPQPMVDVHDLGWLPLGSTVVARHLTMLAPTCGARHEERAPAYLHNLERLGLVWFAEDPVDDLERYRVLEAQPNVEQAVEQATREKFVRRSVHLTPFGAEFCRVALPVDVVEGATGVLGDVFPVEEFDAE